MYVAVGVKGRYKHMDLKHPGSSSSPTNANSNPHITCHTLQNKEQSAVHY